MPKLSFLSGRAFDAGLAALAAVSAGFVAFAMPDPLFSGLVETSRLPDFVAAARPPLGDTARSAATGAAALGTFAAVWALMALLGRAPARREAAPEPAIQVPRQRRADAHPDAPPRPPLLARDLGEPLELDEIAPEPAEETVFEERFEEADRRPLPGFLVAQEPELEPEPEAEPVDPEPQPIAEAEPEPEAWTRPIVEPEPEAEPVQAAAAVPIAELAARLPEAEPEETNDQSLSQLVNRIEFGMSRKRQALPAVDLPPAEPPSPEQEKVGHRLRSAISDLQKIASSGA
ncbi:MAG TPA: hypothetical protein VF605_12130 [Allosphingosinicella sp.]|jgi:hypothetical protein